jgi:RNase H-fold protein (predicted Holliday junction resolvase)
LAKREGIEAFVVGLPLPTEAHQSETQLERTISFITELEKESGLSVFVVDEQFTSAEARRVRSEQGSDLAEDVLAAMLILQAYFDEQLRQRR